MSKDAITKGTILGLVAAIAVFFANFLFNGASTAVSEFRKHEMNQERVEAELHAQDDLLAQRLTNIDKKMDEIRDDIKILIEKAVR